MSKDAVFTYKGCLGGHGDWVTSIQTAEENPNILISSSRDKTVMTWTLFGDQYGQGEDRDEAVAGTAHRSLHGHSQAVSDLSVSKDGVFIISSSWDKTLRLWDSPSGTSLRQFKGHTSDVFSVSLSPCNRQIVSASRDRTIKVWNTIAACKFVLAKASTMHKDWVTCIRFSPNDQPAGGAIVSASRDKTIKIWSGKTFELQQTLSEHTGFVNSIVISPDGGLCASGGADGVAMLWDINRYSRLCPFSTQTAQHASCAINSLCFSPTNYWLSAATDKSVLVWDLENREQFGCIYPEKPRKSGYPWATSLAWARDGRTLFVGTTEGNILVYETSQSDIGNT